MSEPDERLLTLLERWHEYGEQISVEELCVDCPDLREELEKQIRFQIGLKPQGGVAAPNKVHVPAGLSTVPPEVGVIQAAPPMPRLPGYEVLNELGRGGMGVVYRARQIELDRVCALKMILAGSLANENDLHRFRQEAKAIARLQHPNIVVVYEIGQHDGQPYFSLEFCAGGSLEKRLADTLPPREAAALVQKLAVAVQSAHQARVIHRDLKPANMLLVDSPDTPLERCTPKIADFGLAKLLDANAGQTHIGDIMGTPSYMAPEQAKGEQDIGPAADVYGLGGILFWLLTRRPPFQGASPFDTLSQVVNDPPVSPRHWRATVPESLDALCLRCLEKDPARRPTVPNLIKDLEAILAADPVQTELTQIELTIDRPLDSFTAESQKKLLEAIGSLLSVSGDIRVIRKLDGSVKLTLALTSEEAEQLLWAVRAGKFKDFGVIDAQLIPPVKDMRSEREQSRMVAARSKFDLPIPQHQRPVASLPSLVRVFVSSTWLDLQPERQAVERVLQRLRETKLVGMEYFGSRPGTTRDVSLEEVDRSDLYLGLFGGRYGSGITEAEYRRARQRNLPCFIYVKSDAAIPSEARDPDLDNASRLVRLKEELRRNHTVRDFTSPDNLEAQVTADLHNWLTSTASAPALSPGAPNQAPLLPVHFVARPEVIAGIEARLLDDQPATPGVLVISAIHGLGGVGKSTLVAALAHDPRVQARFPSGVLWATLGQDPELLSLLGGWIQSLGDHHFRPVSVAAASAHLRGLLQGRSCLLVVDDAWDYAHVQPFLAGGSRCRVVITTRDAMIARGVGAALYDLEVMNPEQALELLARRVGSPLEGPARELALAVAEAVGFLPLALELAAVQVSGGIPWAELLDDLRAEITRLDVPGAEEVTDAAHLKRLSLLGSLSLSLARLDEKRRSAFAWLGVLPEDAGINPVMASTLWDTDVRTARDALRYLRDKALLLPGNSLADNTPTYRLHDLLHDLARRLLTGPRKPVELPTPGLGLTLPQAQRILIDRYRKRTRDGLWHTLPDDGHIHAHLSWHLEQAERGDEVYTLLGEQTASGRNGWYEACEKQGLVAGYLDDVARAWRLAEQSVGRQCRYALLLASVNSLATSIPPPLLAALVEKGVWRPDQGLAFARRISQFRSRVDGLVRMAPHLPRSLQAQALGEALEAVEELPDRDDRTRELGWLARLLAAVGFPDDALPTALRVPETDWSGNPRLKLLSDLAERLAEVGHWREAAAAAEAIAIPEDRAQALAAIERLREPGKEGPPKDQNPPPPPGFSYGEALRARLTDAIAIPDREGRARAMAELAPHLDKGMLEEALAAVEAIGDDEARMATLFRLAPGLSEQELRVAFELARTLPDPDAKAAALAVLVETLPAPLLKDALSEALSLPEDSLLGNPRAAALGSILPRLVVMGQQQDALDALETVRDPDARAWVSIGLASIANAEQRQRSLAAVRRIGNPTERLRALLALAPYLDEPLLEEAVAATNHFASPGDRVQALAGLAPYLRDPLLGRTIAWAKQFRNPDERTHILAALAQHLSPELREKTAQAALQMDSPSEQVRCLVAVARHLPSRQRDEILQKALAVAGGIGRPADQAHALAALAPELLEPSRTETLHRALAAAQAIEGEHRRFAALAALAPQLATIPNADLAPWWRQALLTLAARTRRNLLDDFRALLPILITLGGTEAVDELLDAIVDVGRWWP